MKRKLCITAALAADSIILLMTVYSVATFFVGSGDRFMTGADFSCFRYFTIDSNVLAAIACCLAIPGKIRALSGRPAAYSRPLLLLKYAGTSAVTVTMLTVLLFLGPTMGYAAMFNGPSLWLHGINPFLAILVFVLYDAQGRLRFRDWLFGELPVAIYACLYMLMVLILKAWPDFYGFNAGGRWYISGVAMLLGAALISMGLYAAQRRRTSQKQ